MFGAYILDYFLYIKNIPFTSFVLLLKNQILVKYDPSLNPTII